MKFELNFQCSQDAEVIQIVWRQNYVVVVVIHSRSRETLGGETIPPYSPTLTEHQKPIRIQKQELNDICGHLYVQTVMLNEAKISRPGPRPRPGSWGRGRDRGQSFEVKAEANFLRSRPRPRPKIKSGIKNIKWWLTTYRRIYIIMIKMTQLISHSLSHSNYLLS